MNQEIEQEKTDSQLCSDIRKQYIQLFSFLFITSLILFISAGRISWSWAWIYILIFIVHNAVNALILPAELIAERGKSKDNVKKWDKILTLLGIIPAFGALLIAGLDERFSWTPELGISIHIIGIVFYVLGDVIVSWSMASNSYFSTLVRIQDDREHQVATSGPYRYVRHPGYVGIILNTLFTPLILGSLWALIPSFIVVILFVLRTIFEDRTLHEELEGYQEFAERVRYRLLPLIW